METKSYSASEWYAEFIQEWIDLSQGRAAGANFDGLVPRVYAAHAAENPREVARQEWGVYRTVLTGYATPLTFSNERMEPNPSIPSSSGHSSDVSITGNSTG